MATGEDDLLQLTPKMPTLEELSAAEEVSVDYDRDADTLMVHWRDPARPAVSVSVHPHVYLRVDPETEEVLGAQIEDFLSRVVYDEPAFLPLLPSIGIPQRDIERIRQKIAATTDKRAVAELIFGRFIPPGMIASTARHE